jgi:hypothetical protein
MPPKKIRAGAPKTSGRVRRLPERLRDDNDDDDNANGNDQPLGNARRGPAVTAAMLNDHREEVAGQLAEFDATLQANTQAIHEVAQLLHEMRQQQQPNNGGPQAQGPVMGPQGNLPPGQAPRDVLSRWPWVDRSLIEDIANGSFNIYSLPQLHRDEYLRNRHIAKSVDGILQPLSGSRPQLVQAKSKLQSSLRNIEILLST